MSLNPTAELNALRARTVERIESLEKERQREIEQSREKTRQEREKALAVKEAAIKQASTPDQKSKQIERMQQTQNYYSKLEKSRIEQITGKYARERGIKNRNIMAVDAIEKQGMDAAISFRDTAAGKWYIEKNLPGNLQTALGSASALKGSEKNVAVNKVKYLASGYGSPADFDRIRAAEVKNRKKALQQSAGLRAGGVKQNFSNSMFSTKQQLSKQNEPIKHQNKGTGTTTDPFRAQQPDPNMLSPYLMGKTGAAYQTNIMQDSFRAVSTQGPARYSVTTPDGKVRTFEDKGTAEKFMQRIKGSYTAKTGIKVPGNVLGFISPTQILLKDEKTAPQVTTGERQNYPKSYKLSDITLENVARGFWEGSLLPLGQAILAPKPIFTDIFGRSEAEKEALRKTTVGIKKNVPAGPTFTGSVIADIAAGRKPRGTGEGLGYDFGSFAGDVALAAVPTKKVPIPLRVVPAKIPTTAGPQTVARVIRVGIGTRSKPALSVTQGKIQLGSPKLTKQVEAVPITPKQQQRGIKLAADVSQTEQEVLTNIGNLRQVRGVSAVAIKKAEVIKNIIATGTKSRDPVRQSFPKQPFKKITETETPSVFESFKGQQGLLSGKLGPLEGSLSQQPYILPKYMRQAGDFDFNVSKYSTAAKRATQTAKEIDPDVGRIYTAKTSDVSKSAKVWLSEKGKSEKVGEFLNPEEKDASGISQVILGDTLFGKTVPAKTDKVAGLKTYNLQRQFLKKGESLFSLQKTGSQYDLGPAPFRTKDIADFYAIGKTKAENLRLQGKTREAALMESELEKFKRLYRKDINIDEFFRKKAGAEPDNITLNYQKSIADKLRGSSDSAGISIGSGAKGSAPSGSEISNKIQDSLYGGGKSGGSRYSGPKSFSSKGIEINKKLDSLTNKQSPSKSPPKKRGVDSPSVKSIGVSPRSLGSLGNIGRQKGSRTTLFRSDRQPAISFEKKKPVPVVPFEIKTRKSFGVPRPRNYRKPFIGNVREESILGYYGRESETTYNPKKILDLTTRDKTKTRKDYRKELTRFSKSKKGSV